MQDIAFTHYVFGLLNSLLRRRNFGILTASGFGFRQLLRSRHPAQGQGGYASPQPPLHLSEYEVRSSYMLIHMLLSLGLHLTFLHATFHSLTCKQNVSSCFRRV